MKMSPLGGSRKPSFFSKYIVTIVTVPGIIAIHYGWMLLQDNRQLVAEHEKIGLPPVAKYFWNRLQGIDERSGKGKALDDSK